MPVIGWGSALLVAGGTFILVKLVKYSSWVRTIELIPGPERKLLVGTLHKHKPPQYLEFLRETSAACSHMFRIWLGPIQPVIIVNHPDTIRTLINANPPKAPMFYRYVRYWLGDQSLLLQEGEAWKSSRHLITPAFHFTILQEYAEIAEAPTHELIEIMKAHAAKTPDEPLELFHTLSLYTLDVLCRCSLSYESHCQSSHKDEYTEMLEEVAALIIKRVETVAHVFDFIYTRSEDGKRFYSLCDQMHGVSDTFIERRRKEIGDKTAADVGRKGTTGKKIHLDFLDRLILARDGDNQPLTAEEIRHQVDTFMFAGHDTTASAISWLLYNLSRNPEEQEKCRQEVDDVLGGNHPQYSDLGQLPYLTATIKESLRTHPPVVGVARMLERDLDINGTVLPAGTTVVANSYALHHNPEVWPDPTRFDPERFLAGVTRDGYSFMPFSIGSRNCIGQNFALNEIKIAVACILQKLVVLEAKDNVPQPVAKIVLRSDNGIHIKLRSRTDIL